MLLTDYHAHILPQIDDGAKNVETSLRMIGLLWEQGIRRVVATPHFYAHCENSVAEYLQKRRNAYERILEVLPKSMEDKPEIYLGAEVAIEQGVSCLKGIEKLCLGNSPYILLELPYAPFAHWMLEEIDTISNLYGLTPVMAHIHRYVQFYSKKQLSDLLQMDAVFQINNSAFRWFRERNFARRIIKEGYPYLFGSDAHNMTERRPDWDFLRRKVRESVLEEVETLW